MADSGCGTGATALQTATLALVHSTAVCCAPAWCLSTHTRLIDPAINHALQTVTGCLRPSLVDTGQFSCLRGIQPTELCRKGATLSLPRHAMDLGHLLHSALTRLPVV